MSPLGLAGAPAFELDRSCQCSAFEKGACGDAALFPSWVSFWIDRVD